MPGTDREIQDNHSRDPQDADGYHHAPLKESADRHVAHGWKSGLVYPRPGPLPLKGHGTYEDQLIPREHAEFRSPRAGPTHVGSSILDPEEALELCRAGWAVAQGGVNSLLDIGSGDGTLLCMLEKHYGMPDAVGIDISAQNVNKGNDVAGYVKKAGDVRTNIRLYAGDIATVHLPMYRDLITAFDTLSFTQSPHESLLRVCTTALRMAGCVIVTDYCWLQKAFAVDKDARPLFPAKARTDYEQLMGFTSHGVPTVDGWRSCLEQAGLSIVRDSNTSGALKTRINAMVASDPTNARHLATQEMAANGYLGHWAFVATKINEGDPCPYGQGRSSSPTEGRPSSPPQCPDLRNVRSVRTTNDRYAALRGRDTTPRD